MAWAAASTYDVYLSFRGEDTRRSFASYLYGALCRRGIHTFFDIEFVKGDELTPAISRAIEESRIAIILFSQNYAFSSFCLEELATIVDRFKEERLRRVLPVFYDVKPSDVRKQRGSYGEAFARREERFKDDKEKLNRWRMALTHAANLPGFVSTAFRNEAELIGMIAKEVLGMIDRPLLHVADYPVGLESRMLEVTSLLDVKTDDEVHMVGIHGIGGIGKSTLARAVYNFISDQFEGSCFLQDVRQKSARHDLVHLQDIVLSEILGDMDINLLPVKQGMTIMQRRLSRKKVLLVLDDVDRKEQLEALAGGFDWFGSGSRIIITTRDMRLLALHGVARSYRVEELSDKEACDLLTWNAFKTDKVDPSYTEVLNRAVTYCSRLPLALEVLGSHLFGRSLSEWHVALSKYKRSPHHEILHILKLSYDSLDDDEQSIFLDIACFFNGQKLADIEDILWAHHGFSTKFFISVLIEKSLITIDDGRVILHDLIQDMGREIVRQESPYEPGKRSRLWFIDDVVRVLQENEGSSANESIFLDFPKDDGPEREEVDWDGEAFKKMINLKTLIIRNGHFNKGPTHLPQSLRVLKWSGYPSPSLPDDFHPKKLAILELPESCLKISEPIQGFVCLTVLDFGYCEWITHIPDVSGLRNLEKLSFKHTENLIHIHESVGFLEKLRILDAICCKKLKNFPPISMTSLEQFHLSQCSNLEVFPEILGKMGNITELHITGSPIKELPLSIQNLTRLQKLELQVCGMVQMPSSIVMLPELGSMCVLKCEGLQLSKLDKGEKMVSKSSNMECLILSYCNISDDFFPTSLTFANVKDLNLSGNNFTVLHACFKECHLLRNLNLDDCRFLREIRGIPEKLETLSVKECRSLKFLDLTVLPACTEGCHFLKELILDECVFLEEIEGLLPNLDHFSAKNCTSLTSRFTNMLLDQESIEAGNKMFSLPGTKIPWWFAHRRRGESISFWFRNKFPTISICLAIGPVDELPITVKFSPQVFVNRNEQLLANQKAYEFRIATDHIFLFDIQLLNFEDIADVVLSDDKWNCVEVSYADHITNHEVPIRVAAKHSGIHVFKQTSGMEDVKFTNPPQAMMKVNFDPNSLERHQRVKITTNRPQKDQTMLPSLPILSSGLDPRPTPLVEESWEEVQGETTEYLPEEEVHPSTVQNDPPNIERCEGGDIELEAVSTSELEAATYSYDVFLSFRGEDARRSFTSHLYEALSQRGIRIFFEMELEKGDELWQAISKAIEESRIAIILFSQNYAFSSFCLDELATILDCFEEKKLRRVFPVFYDVHPLDVRHLRGSYGEAFARHEKRFKDDKEKLNRWRTALSHAANFAGFDSRTFSYESEFIATIVKAVSSMINHQLRIPLHVTDYPVGLESRMLKVMQLLKVETDDGVHVVGIYGMGGIGKTTIARAVYAFIRDQFDGSCFLEDVRERSARYGLVHLQEIILSAILEDMNIDLRNVNHGILVIKERLGRKKVLLVLDDADKIEQLQAVVGGLGWFGSGSRVIISTQDKLLLEQHGVKSSYRVEELTRKEAHDLFNWHAFKTDKLDPSYMEVLNRAVTCCSRLPLELKVMGSYLFGRNMDQWNDALNWYKKVPHREILDILKVSFDSLEKEEQEILLDIACFFNGQKLADIEYILWVHHGFSTEFSISVLIDKSLLNIDDGRVILHDTIQDMGREIVRQESPNEPGKRSRLWFIDDVVQVLEQNEGSSTIESIFLDFPKGKVHWDGKAFKKMENLKTLIIRNGCFNKGPTHLPQSLRVMRWWGYPSPSLPYDCHPKKLVILELPESCLMISEPIQGFVYLTVLDFGYCEWITRIPDVSGLPNLEKLSFKHCENLIQIHESVGFLDKLRILDAICCKKLRTFPPIRMTSLEQFNLSHCSNLEVFPEILGKMENITELHITGSPIKELPFSIQNLTRLQKLELQFCGMVWIPSSIVMLPELGSMCVSHCEGLQLSKLDKGENMMSNCSNLEILILLYCNISDDFLPTGLTLFANVKELNLSGNKFTILDACFKEFHLLRNLKLDDCKSLTKIRGIPVKLEKLSMKGCEALEFLDLTVLSACTEGCHFLKELVLDDCVLLHDIRGLLSNLDNFSAKNCTSLTSSCTSMLLHQKSIEAGNKMFSLPGTKIPEWFSHRTSGETISFCFRNKFPTIFICLVIGPVDEQPITVKFSPRVFINGNKQFIGDQKAYEFGIATDHIFFFDMQLLKFEDNADVLSDDKWNRVVVSYADHITNNEVPIRLAAKYSGIHTSDLEDVKFTNHPEEMIKVILDPNSLEGHQGVKIMKSRHQKDLTVLPSSSVLTSDLASRLTPSVESPWEDVQGLTSECNPEYEVHPTTVQNNPPYIERCEGDDIELEPVSTSQLESEDSSSNITDSDSDDPFDHIDKKFCVSGKETISSGACSGDASLTSIREAIDALELLMIEDLSEVSSDPAMQSQLNHFLNLLTTSNYPRVTIEMKEALVEFKRKAFTSFQEFQATVESVNKLKNFEKQKARIQKETSAGKDRRKDLKNSIKKASLAIKAENRRKMELEAEIATLRKQLSTKETDLEQLVLNVKNLEAELSTYVKNRNSLDEQARALCKEADNLLAANNGVEDEGKTAEEKQNLLNWTWSTDLTSQLSKIKNNILGL